MKQKIQVLVTAIVDLSNGGHTKSEMSAYDLRDLACGIEDGQIEGNAQIVDVEKVPNHFRLNPE
jgi:hypothetical protein